MKLLGSRIQRTWPRSRKREDLMNKTEVRGFENHETRLCIRVYIRLIVKRVMCSHQVGSIEDSIGGSEHVQLFEEVAAAYVTARNQGARNWQPRQCYSISLQCVSANDSYRRMRFGYLDHPFQAI